MDIETWFAPAIELGRLVKEYRDAPPKNREKLERQIRNSAHLSRLHIMQSYSGTGFLQGILPEQKINVIKKDFFMNPATPSPQTPGEPHYQMPYHRHDYLELIFVLRGRYIQSINGVLYELRAGEACMLNPNVEISGMEDRVVFIGLSAGFLKGELTRFFAPYPEIAAFMENQYGRTDQQFIQFKPRDFSQVPVILGQIAEEDERKLPGHHMVIKGYLVRLFVILVERRCYTCHYQSRGEIEENLLAEILKYMEDHMADVDRRGLGFSNKGHFNRMFSEKYGMLPGVYRKEG